jgi:hypothetical protein
MSRPFLNRFNCDRMKPTSTAEMSRKKKIVDVYISIEAVLFIPWLLIKNNNIIKIVNNEK